MQRKKVNVLYLGKLKHQSEGYTQRLPIFRDEIDFGCVVQIELLRIPKPGRNIYGRLTSQKQFQIFYKNLEAESGRMSLLITSNELLANEADDILFVPKEPVTTSMLVVRGCYTLITLCVYGSPMPDSLVPSDESIRIERRIPEKQYGRDCSIKDLFNLKREEVLKCELSSNGLPQSTSAWGYGASDDENLEQTMQNICDFGQSVFSSFTAAEKALSLKQEEVKASLRFQLEQLTATIAKLFKLGHYGLYYQCAEQERAPKISQKITQVALKFLGLEFSDQSRALELLKYTLQLEPHVRYVIESGQLGQLLDLFVSFHVANPIVLSTFRTLITEVFISIAHWDFVASKMIVPSLEGAVDRIEKVLSDPQIADQSQLLQAPFLGKQNSEKPLGKEESSDSDDDSGDDDKKKKKKKKKSKKDKKEKTERVKEPKEKTKKQSKEAKRLQKEQIKQQIVTSQSKERLNQAIVLPVSKNSFYQLVALILVREKNVKNVTLLKALLEQITQTQTRSKEVSEQLASYTSYFRDTKFLFAQNGEVINGKTLKTFAVFQPFLNDIQSRGIDSRFITEAYKLKNPSKYGVNPETYRLMTATISNVKKLQRIGFRNDRCLFNSTFIVLISELIAQPDRPIISGFSCIIDWFKTHSLNGIKLNEAALTILGEYIYKALLEDDGLQTVYYMDQLHSSLLKITSFLIEDSTLFSNELRRAVKFLSNYAMPYDSFLRTQTLFKNFCDYFLKLFRYEKYQMNKITEFDKKDYQRLANPYLYQHLKDAHCLGNFFELYPNQSQKLLEIDVCLKILLVIVGYNKNIWTIFYEEKLVSGFCMLLNKVGPLLVFYIQQSPERYTNLVETKKYSALINNYVSVVRHLLMLLAKKSQYESAFNELLDEDLFEDVELYERCIEIYAALFSTYREKSLLHSSEKFERKATAIMGHVIEIFTYLLDSYELTNHFSRQIKIKRLVHRLYVEHFETISQRAAYLTLLTALVKHAQGASLKVLVNLLFDQPFEPADHQCSFKLGYIPTHTRKIVQELFGASIYRSNEKIAAALSQLMRVLLQKPVCQEKATLMIEVALDRAEESLKLPFSSIDKIQGQIALSKVLLLTEFLVNLNLCLRFKIDEKLFKLLKSVESYREKASSYSHLEMFLRIRNNILTVIVRLLEETNEWALLLPLIKVGARFVEDVSIVMEGTNLHYEQLRSARLMLQGLVAASKDPYSQSMILYSEFLSKPYKASGEISLIKLHHQLHNADLKAVKNAIETVPAKNIKFKLCFEIRSIALSLASFLVRLTSIDGEQFYTTESRRNAIVGLISDDKDFSFPLVAFLEPLVPKEILDTLRDYFNFPIVQKAITIRQKIAPLAKKSKSVLFAKCLFKMISEGEPVSRSRYPLIAGEWLGGDIGTGLYSPFKQRNFSDYIRQILSEVPNVLCHKLTQPILWTALKDKKQLNQLFYLQTNRKCIEPSKGPIEVVIKLRDVPDILEPRKEAPKTVTSHSPNRGAVGSLSSPQNGTKPTQPNSIPPKNLPMNSAPPPMPPGVNGPSAPGRYQSPQPNLISPGRASPPVLARGPSSSSNLSMPGANNTQPYPKAPYTQASYPYPEAYHSTNPNVQPNSHMNRTMAPQPPPPQNYYQHPKPYDNSYLNNPNYARMPPNYMPGPPVDRNYPYGVPYNHPGKQTHPYYHPNYNHYMVGHNPTPEWNPSMAPGAGYGAPKSEDALVNQAVQIANQMAQNTLSAQEEETKRARLNIILSSSKRIHQRVYYYMQAQQQ